MTNADRNAVMSTEPAYELIRLDPDCDSISMMITKPGLEGYWWSAVYEDAVAWEDEYDIVDRSELAEPSGALYDPPKLAAWLQENVKPAQFGWYRMVPEDVPGGEAGPSENDMIVPAAEGDDGAVYGAFIELREGVRR